MEDGNLAVLVDAKTEYTKQLINILKYNLFLSITKIFIEAKIHCDEQNTSNMVLNKFQELLSNIPTWNQDIINKEYESIIETSKCDWLDELITAVFVSHTRILTSINFNKNKNKINLKIPKTTHFIHKCFIDVARYFWKNAYLFDDRVNNYERQKNRRETEIIIEQSINETIRKQLPVKHTLKEYLRDAYTEDENTFDENDATKNNLNLRNMVINEIKTCTNEQLNLIQNSIKEDNSNKASQNEAQIEIIDNITPNLLDVYTPEEPLKIEDPLQTEPVQEQFEEPVQEQFEEPVQEQFEEPVQEQFEEPVQEQLVEPVPEYFEEPVQEQLVEPVQEQLAEPVPEQSVEPVQEQLVEPVQEQLVEQVQEQLVEPVQEQLVEPVQEQLVEPVQEQLVEPVVEPILTDSVTIVDPPKTVVMDSIKMLEPNQLVVPDKNSEIHFDTLQLEDMDDLSKLEEVYITPKTTNELCVNPTNIKEVKSDVKTILINTNKSKESNNEINSENTDTVKTNIINKYKTNKEFTFF